MKEINLGSVLIKYRHKSGITQEDLAAYMGVSKAAVSKWETGTTYPDITLLPKLAAYFNISIDELISFKPQMTQDEIRQLHWQLAKEFAAQPIEQALEHCRELTEKYFSCFPLLYQIGSLYVNHYMLAKDQQQMLEMLENAMALFIRVKTRTDDITLAKQALNMEALCLLTLNRPHDVLDLLGPPDGSMTSDEPLQALAYQALGNKGDAKRILQTGIYQHIVLMMNLLSIHLGLCLDNQKLYDQIYQRALSISDTFQLEKLHPSILLSFDLTAAKGYMKLGDTNKALQVLEHYTALAAGSIYPLRLQGDEFFDLIDQWLENTASLGNALPRDCKIIQESIVKSLENNKAFLPLQNNPRFQNMIRRLNTIPSDKGAAL